MEKLIITVAPTGSLPTKEMNPNTPISPEEIAGDAKRCLEAGASILHIHARDEQGVNTSRVEIFKEIMERVSESAPRMIRQISTGGRAGMGLDERRERLVLDPPMASLTTGSVNFPNMIYENSPQTIEGLAEEMIKRSIKPEVEVFDLSMINNALELQKKNLIKQPIHFNFVMGLKGACPATVKNLSFLVDSIPDKSTWCVSGIGRFQLPMAIAAILMGGHVRVGLEDNIYYKKGVLATNVQLIERIVRLANELGRETASPEEAAQILGLT